MSCCLASRADRLRFSLLLHAERPLEYREGCGLRPFGLTVSSAMNSA